MSFKTHILLFTFVVISLAGWSTAMPTSIKDSNVENNEQRQYDKEWRIQQLKSRLVPFFNRTNSYGDNQNKIGDRKKTDKNTRINEIQGRFETFFNSTDPNNEDHQIMPPTKITNVGHTNIMTPDAIVFDEEEGDSRISTSRSPDAIIFVEEKVDSGISTSKPPGAIIFVGIRLLGIDQY